MSDIPDEALNYLAADIHAAIETHFPMGSTPEQVRPHVAGLLRDVRREIDDDEKDT